MSDVYFNPNPSPTGVRDLWTFENLQEREQKEREAWKSLDISFNDTEVVEGWCAQQAKEAEAREQIKTLVRERIAPQLEAACNRRTRRKEKQAQVTAIVLARIGPHLTRACRKITNVRELRVAQEKKAHKKKLRKEKKARQKARKAQAKRLNAKADRERVSSPTSAAAAKFPRNAVQNARSGKKAQKLSYDQRKEGFDLAVQAFRNSGVKKMVDEMDRLTFDSTPDCEVTEGCFGCAVKQLCARMEKKLTEFIEEEKYDNFSRKERTAINTVGIVEVLCMGLERELIDAIQEDRVMYLEGPDLNVAVKVAELIKGRPFKKSEQINLERKYQQFCERYAGRVGEDLEKPNFATFGDMEDAFENMLDDTESVIKRVETSIRNGKMSAVFARVVDQARPPVAGLRKAKKKEITGDQIRADGITTVEDALDAAAEMRAEAMQAAEAKTLFDVRCALFMNEFARTYVQELEDIIEPLTFAEELLLMEASLLLTAEVHLPEVASKYYSKLEVEAMEFAKLARGMLPEFRKAVDVQLRISREEVINSYNVEDIVNEMLARRPELVPHREAVTAAYNGFSRVYMGTGVTGEIGTMSFANFGSMISTLEDTASNILASSIEADVADID